MSLARKSPTEAAKAVTEPREATAVRARLAALPCGRALRRVDSSTPSWVARSTALVRRPS
jgi:hypothetical protein